MVDSSAQLMDGGHWGGFLTLLPCYESPYAIVVVIFLAEAYINMTFNMFFALARRMVSATSVLRCRPAFRPMW